MSSLFFIAALIYLHQLIEGGVGIRLTTARKYLVFFLFWNLDVELCETCFM